MEQECAYHSLFLAVPIVVLDVLMRLPGGKVHSNITDEILSYIDILVDGPFVADEKNIRLKFRGSNNQRIIDVKCTKQAKKIVL